MRRSLIYVLLVVATFFACNSADDVGDGNTPPDPCCTADDPACGIAQNEAGVCLACCRGATCGFAPEEDGACPGPVIPDGAAQCAKDEDCGKGFACGYPISQGCGAVGTCVSIDASSCDRTTPFCGCNGQTVTCVVEGFTTAPVIDVGACPSFDGGSDGASEASSADAPSAD